MVSKPKKSASMRTLSALLERVQAFAGLGLQFDGARDLYAVFGYNKQPEYKDFLQRYARQDIAARIIDAPAASTWKSPPIITGGAGFDVKLKELVKTTSLWSKVERADKLAGLGRYSVLFLGFDDGSDPKMQVRPNGSRKLMYVQPLGESSVKIKKFEASTSSPRFGLPTQYEISVRDPNSQMDNLQIGTLPQLTSSLQDIKVHHSRIVHILENSLEDQVYGIPRLARVYNILDDLLKVCGGSAETFWLTANRGLHADIDKEMELNTDDAADLADKIDEYQHQLRRVIRTRGVKLASLGSDTPDPTGVFKVLIALLAGATGIPQRILLGAEAGQLASEQDRANWSERITERRTSFAEPSVLTPLLDNLTAAGVLPEGEREVEWDEAFIMSPLERAQEMAQKARSAINFSKQGAAPMQITSVDEAREILGLEGSLAESDIVEPPEPEPAPDGGDGGDGGVNQPAPANKTPAKTPDQQVAS